MTSSKPNDFPKIPSPDTFTLDIYITLSISISHVLEVCPGHHGILGFRCSHLPHPGHVFLQGAMLWAMAVAISFWKKKGAGLGDSYSVLRANLPEPSRSFSTHFFIF